MTRSTIGWVVAGLAALCLSSPATAGVEADYKTLFGEEEKALADKGPEGRAELAAKLLDGAKSVGGQKDLQILLCQKAYEYGMKDPSGYPKAIDAMRFLTEAAPDKSAQAQERLLDAVQARYAKSAKADRHRVGEEMMALLVAYGDGRAAARKLTDAAAVYRKAVEIGTDTGSRRIGDIKDKIKQATAALEAEARVTNLKKKLKENPKIAAVRTDLILTYLGEFDSPDEAVKLLTDSLDEKFRTYVPLAAKPVADLEEAACLELAGWYAEVAEKASPAGRAAILGKSKACCQRYLERHADKDSARLKGAMLLAKVIEAQNKAATAAPKSITLDLGKGVTMNLALIPAGKFLMGSSQTDEDRRVYEMPQHEVTISRPFYIGVFEVTQAQYAAVMGVNPSLNVGAKNPVEQVTWDEAVQFCKRLSAKTGKIVRLPTEAQWEYACRAGSDTSLGSANRGAAVGEYAWHCLNTGRGTHPVGQKKSNAWGLYDMLGNVEEWCGDWYVDSYAQAEARDPEGPASGTNRVKRGGGFTADPDRCRPAGRQSEKPNTMDYGVGFRVSADAD
ncbi:MAG: formylglycine-generating enzyme family protein [Planctomycetota bacterium]|nr:formylglycine-generating enzyme family protein [Planctomycetota bacterium]